MGSLNESNPKIIRLVLAFSLFGMLFTSLLARPLNALQLGEAKARYLGINTSLVIKILFVVTSLLTGMSVAVSGVIGFVGLVTPHVTFWWFRLRILLWWFLFGWSCLFNGV
jgi:iron complex transport system permease protein